jgi:hypothetical protein
MIERVHFFLFVYYLPLVLLGAMYPTRNIFWSFPSCRLLITLHIGVNGAHWLPIVLIFFNVLFIRISDLVVLMPFVSISLLLLGYLS